MTLTLTSVATLLFGLVELTAPLWIDALFTGSGSATRDVTSAFTKAADWRGRPAVLGPVA